MTAKKTTPTTIAAATAAFDEAVKSADGAAALSVYFEYLRIARQELNADYRRRAAKVREHNETTQDVRDAFAQLRALYNRWDALRHARNHIATGVLSGSTASAAEVEAARRAYVELAKKLDARIVADGHDPYLGVGDDDEPRNISGMRGGVHGAYWEESLPSGGDRRGESFDVFLAASRKRLGL